MRYEEFTPPATIACFVEAFWQFTLDADDPAEIVHTILPDGAVSMAASYWNGDLIDVTIMGPGETAQQAMLVQGMHVVGARLCPGAAQPILGLAPETIMGTMQSLPAEHWAVAAFANGLQGLATAMEQRRAQLPLPDELIRAAAQAIELGEPIAAVAANLGLSPRQLQRRFRAAVGLSPKVWQRIRRQRLAWINHVTGEAATLTEAAHSAGFADSAHFSRETQRSFQWSTRAVAAYLASIDHGVLYRPSDNSAARPKR